MALDRQNSHRDFDDLIADSANMQEFAYEDKAWAMMSDQLDRHDRGKRRRYWMILLLLVGMGGIGLLISSKQDINSSQNAAVAHEVVNNDVMTAASAMHGNVEESVAQRTLETNTGTTSNTRSNMDNRIRQQVMANVQSSIGPIEGTSRQVAEQIDNDPIVVAESKGERPTSSIRQLVNLRPSLAPLDMNYTLPRYADLLTEENSVASKLSLVASVASEWSAVRFNTMPTLGWRVGGDIHYELSDHWALGIGVGLSKKVYGGSGDDFTKKDGWMEDVSPMAMKAKCYIVDVPLIATYRLNGHRNGWYISGGVSNYFLTSEWYGFEYSEVDRDFLKSRGVTPLDEITINDNNNNHWIGAGHLAIGYERSISDHLHIGVAPYISVPLTGIGEGAVKLHSAGIRMTARLR